MTTTTPTPTTLPEDDYLRAEPPPLGAGTTLVEGTTFCVCDPSGDVVTDRPQGLFVQDTRVLSTWRLFVDGRPVEALATMPAEPFDSTYVGRAHRQKHDEPTLVVERRRLIGSGMREDVTVRNFGTEPAGLALTLEADADFADLFAVKEGRATARGPVGHRATGSDLEFWVAHEGARRGVRISAPDAVATSHALSFRVVVPAQDAWSTTVEVLPSVEGVELPASFPADRPVESGNPSVRMATWRKTVPDIRVGHPVMQLALDRAAIDLGALRIVDPSHPEDDVVAAGAPWFMALFGRDSLLTGWMVLPFAPGLAVGTLRTLARLQGTRDDPLSEEEPGRIVHEVRLGIDPSLALGGESVYYGTTDATPLFVMLVDRALRWGVPISVVTELLPAVDAALEWMLTDGDKDGDGLLEYERKTDRGLLNQGWKDSHDGVNFADGRLAQPPIALAEVQGYAYGAYRARAHIADVLGDGETATRWARKAADLRQAFDDAFWLADRGYYALALDREKRPVDALASNQGHCLWTGIVGPERSAQVAQHLTSDAMFTGFGVRTLADGMRRFNPVSYHNGSVWPHDSALVAAGLSRAGHKAHASRVVDGLVDAVTAFNGRMPELFCGFSRRDVPWPAPYPTSCSPQAWASASAFELLRTSVSLEACVPHGRLHVGPARQPLADVEILGLRLGDARVDIRSTSGSAEVTGAPAGLSVVTDGSLPQCLDDAGPR